jgi:hypothetical protein
MKRKELITKLEHQPYSYWKTVAFPHVYTEQRADAEIGVELMVLEDDPAYLHIGIALDDDKWSRKLLPVSSSFIVKKSAR